MWAGGLRIVSDESYMGLGKNLLFTEFTSIPDWHYEAPNFWAFYGALARSDMACLCYSEPCDGCLHVDLDKDPFQLSNIVGSLAKPVLEKMLARLHELWQCQAAECA